MGIQNPDSVTLFFRNPGNIRRLRVSELLKLAESQTTIDNLKAKPLNDFDLANRDIQVGHERQKMNVIVEGAMVDGRSAGQPIAFHCDPTANARHMTAPKPANPAK